MLNKFRGFDDRRHAGLLRERKPCQSRRAAKAASRVRSCSSLSG